MHMDTSLALLQKTALFQTLPLPALEEIARLSRVRAVEESGYYFMQGEEARYLYVLTSGRVKLIQLTADGQQVTMRMLYPGQMFAGTSILSPGEGYPVSAESVEDSSALAWEAAAFKKLAEKYPALSINLMQLMRAYIVEMQSRYLELSTERVEQRVARALVRLAAQSGARSPEGPIVLALSRQDLAEMSGTTLYTTSRLLAEWERRGIIAAGRERVQLINPHGLVAIAEDLAVKE